MHVSFWGCMKKVPLPSPPASTSTSVFDGWGFDKDGGGVEAGYCGLKRKPMTEKRELHLTNLWLSLFRLNYLKYKWWSLNTRLPCHDGVFPVTMSYDSIWKVTKTWYIPKRYGRVWWGVVQQGVRECVRVFLGKSICTHRKTSWTSSRR